MPSQRFDSSQCRSITEAGTSVVPMPSFARIAEPRRAGMRYAVLLLGIDDDLMVGSM
jgi:hypothetical protein